MKEYKMVSLIKFRTKLVKQLMDIPLNSDCSWDKYRIERLPLLIKSCTDKLKRI